ncbi:putative ATP-binding cassette sub-family A member 3, partial [Operophtera brumata]
MSATSGSVFVNGLDSVKHRDQVRSQLGLCPQHNLFFPDLTIVEQIIFFTLLKGGSISEARQSSRVLLERLGLSEKANSKSSELSGGMKRRLQLALSLAGGASVLVLDEPTTGLDVETRREMWDLILEADALGDRVAALRTGYRLSFTTNDAPREAAITGVVTSFVREATVKEKTIYSLSYNLPSSGSSQFPELFIALEEKKSELGIKTIGVGVSTLEEVFLKYVSLINFR